MCKPRPSTSKPWERENHLVRHLKLVHHLTEDEAKVIAKKARPEKDGETEEKDGETEVQQEAETEQQQDAMTETEKDGETEEKDGETEMQQEAETEQQQDVMTELPQEENMTIEQNQLESSQQEQLPVENTMPLNLRTASLVYLDPMKRKVGCRLCPTDNRRVIRRIFLDAHLRNSHNVTKSEELALLSSLDATTRTEDGQDLSTRGIGLQTIDQATDRSDMEDGQDQVEDREMPDEQEADRLMPDRLPIGNLCICSFSGCNAEFSRKTSVQRHLKRTHKLSPDIILQLMYMVPNV